MTGSQLKTAYLKEFESDITKSEKSNAVMKHIKISGDRTSIEFESRWPEIVKELLLLQELYHDGDFVWGHSKNLDRVYIAIRAGKSKQIYVPQVSNPSERMALPEVQEFIRTRGRDGL